MRADAPTIAEVRRALLPACDRMGLSAAYEVGGGVRDDLLGRPPKDIDIAVAGMTADALLEAASREGEASELVVAGRLIGVRLRAPWTGVEGVEFALARTEVSTGPSHTDFAIRADPSVSIEEDLRRRDFTVNAIARDLRSGELVDPYHGRDDLRARSLRTVSAEAFRDDPLRILRGLTRLANDDLTVEAATWREMQLYASAFRAPDIENRATWVVSAERVYAEYEKTIAGPQAHRAFGLARDLELLQNTIPEWAAGVGFDQENKHHSLSVDEHQLLTLLRASQFDGSLAVRWAALLHDVGKPESAWRGSDRRLHFYANPGLGKEAHERIGERAAERALTRLRAPAKRIDAVGLLVAQHMYSEDERLTSRTAARNAIRARRFIQRIGREHARDLLLLRRCDRAAKHRDAIDDPAWDLECTAFEALIAEYWSDPVTLGELAIDGNDLLELGHSGQRLGEVQRALLQRVVVDPTHNTPERLRTWAARV